MDQREALGLKEIAKIAKIAGTAKIDWQFLSAFICNSGKEVLVFAFQLPTYQLTQLPN
jgi:hypothetical protein